MFQNIVNSYGVPSYKEINPAFFYLYQFPFTFSIMFGDVGHGLINTILSLLMIIFEKKLSNMHNDMFELIFMGRYIIFFMSLFSILTGFLYNDCFAIGFNLFRSNYEWRWNEESQKYIGYFADDVEAKSPVVKYGMDAFWRWGDNSMIFINSYKMKISVIIGIAQMIFGLIMGLINHINSRDVKTILCKWIPKFLFMLGFFGYMVFTIIYKWLQYWPEGSNPPSLINMLIQVFLSPTSIDKSNQLFNDINKQQSLQFAVFIVSIVCIIWLILAAPIVDIIHLKKHPNPDTSVGDIVIQQVIDCIEYVLGCISHTASYLRLWALSLAHSQLAEVFFDQIMGISMNMSLGNKAETVIIGGLSMLVTYAVWFGATIAVLCLMEALSAFLHALRLAWIEFNQKFFAAEGYQFAPLAVDKNMGIEVTAKIARGQ